MAMLQVFASQEGGEHTVPRIVICVHCVGIIL